MDKHLSIAPLLSVVLLSVVLLSVVLMSVVLISHLSLVLPLVAGVRLLGIFPHRNYNPTNDNG